MNNNNYMVISTECGDMRVEIMDITPEIASELLTKNIDNRSIRENTVKKYVRDMENGNWDYNGETIIFDNDGKLRDGQHRLTAVVESGKTLKYQIVVHLPNEYANCYDIGAKRTLADVAHFEGRDEKIYKHATISGAIKMAVTGTTNSKFSPHEVIDLIAENRDACEYVYEHLLTGGGGKVLQ